MQQEISSANPPKIGDKVFLPELELWGEIVEFYDDNKGLITRVRAMVNGKPTYIDVTNLIVDLAEAVKIAVPLLKKIGAALKSLCQKIGLCKKPQPQPVAFPAALIAKIKELQDASLRPENFAAEYKVDAALAQLQKYFPKS